MPLNALSASEDFFFDFALYKCSHYITWGAERAIRGTVHLRLVAVARYKHIYGCDVCVQHGVLDAIFVT